MTHYSDSEKALIDVWEAHTAAEFEQKDADAAIATMTDHPVLIHVPVNTGATGRTELRRFYQEIFIPQKLARRRVAITLAQRITEPLNR